ncbi:hypothetical protein [Pseudomonas sp. 2822-15]|uniref:hypothetical protein n=1 Tax=Pseudomonas sp. 2822-15 TaxID=1712677 RepID=UPI002114A16C|nr:hypothetical protein [Pseudomonas sp. 2822-15]
MTIDIQIVNAPDISLTNNVINPQWAEDNFRAVLSAASFLVADKSNASLAGVLSFICRLIDKRLPEYDVWLLLGNSAWQPDTRIVRYRKLWGALKFRGYEISEGSDSQESVVEAHGGLKFFGALRLSKLSIASLIDVIVDERCSYIVATPKAFEFKCSLDVGWSGSLAEDYSLCCQVCREDGLLFKQVGEFDDHEWGFISIGSPEIMEKLLS